jgi:hypothetical protein
MKRSFFSISLSRLRLVRISLKQNKDSCLILLNAFSNNFKFKSEKNLKLSSKNKAFFIPILIFFILSISYGSIVFDTVGCLRPGFFEIRSHRYVFFQFSFKKMIELLRLKKFIIYKRSPF